MPMVEINHRFDAFNVKMNHKKSQEPDLDGNPAVTDFVQFYPWACSQFQLGVDVYVEKVSAQGIVSEKSILRLKTPPIEMFDKFRSITQQSVLQLPSLKQSIEVKTDKTNQNSQTHLQKAEQQNAEVKITAMYTRDNNLVELKFTKCNKSDSAKLFKLLQYIIPYYPYLTNVIIKKSIDSLAVYEIGKLIEISNITEVTLDGCTVKEGNYYLLVEELNKLSKLSLARCTINDEIAQTIAVRLCHPQPAAKTLHILNLSSNMITDDGAKIFAEALRTNRQLYYLNFANNSITDDGAFAILETFLEFPLNPKEREDFRKRHWDFVKRKNDLIQKFMIELKQEESEGLTKEAAKMENVVEKGTTKAKTGKKEISNQKLKKSKVKSKTQVFHQINIKEKAIEMAEKILAEHEEPFENVYKKDDILHFSGNHTVRILNLAYNNLTYLSLKKLLKVLEHQKLLNRDPIGLVNVCIEGNYLPKACAELQLIDEILNENVPSPAIKSVKKRSNTSARSSVSVTN